MSGSAKPLPSLGCGPRSGLLRQRPGRDHDRALQARMRSGRFALRGGQPEMRVKYVTRPLAPRASAKWGFRRAGRQRRCDLRRGMVAGVAGRLLRRLQPRVADGRGACHSSGLSVRACCKNVQVVSYDRAALGEVAGHWRRLPRWSTCPGTATPSGSGPTRRRVCCVGPGGSHLSRSKSHLPRLRI